MTRVPAYRRRSISWYVWIGQSGAGRLYAIDRGEIIFQGDPKSALQNQEVMKTIRG